MVVSVEIGIIRKLWGVVSVSVEEMSKSFDTVTEEELKSVFLIPLEFIKKCSVFCEGSIKDIKKSSELCLK